MACCVLALVVSSLSMACAVCNKTPPLNTCVLVVLLKEVVIVSLLPVVTVSLIDCGTNGSALADRLLQIDWWCR